jgi:hypothetical protein
MGRTPEALGILPTAEAERLDRFLGGSSLYILGLAANGTTWLSLAVSCASGSQRARYQLELKTEDGDQLVLNAEGTAVRRTEKQLCGEGGSLQLDIMEEFRRVRVSYVGLMHSAAEESQVVFVRVQAWFQVLSSPIRDWCILSWISLGIDIFSR